MKELVPHITFEYVDWNGTAEGIQEINSAGTVVDLLTPNLGVDVRSILIWYSRWMRW